MPRPLCAELLLLLLAYGGLGPAEAAPAVTLQVWYGTACPNCQNLIRNGLVPLVEAGLPGDQVQLALLPWRTGELGADGLYNPVPGDFTSMGHMCALRSALPMPAPIDAPALFGAVQFLACDLDHLILPDQVRNEASVSQCAAANGLDWSGPGGIKACAEGGQQAEGATLMRSPLYGGLVQAAEEALVIESVTPFVILNGMLLECHGPADCVATWSTDRQRHPLTTPGSLLDVVCGMLPLPKPPACAGAPQGQASAGGYEPACENCDEVGAFRWSREPPRAAASALVVPACAACAAMVGSVLLVRLGGLGGLGRWPALRQPVAGAAADAASDAELLACE